MTAKSPELPMVSASVAPIGYYGLPVIHRPHWKWLIICYFFLGGISGASAGLSAIARFFDRSDGPRIARIAAYVSAAALLPCPVLLVLDLGRPTRFLNMLRVLRLSSPMSMGSWGLAAFGAISTIVTSTQILIDDLERRDGQEAASRWKGSLSLLAPFYAALGCFLAGYTGVLLSATAVPLWSKRPWLLGPLFLSSATSSGTAAVVLAISVVDPYAEAAEAKLSQFENVATMAETALLIGWVYALGSTAKPITEGHLGAILRHAVVGVGIAVPRLLNAGSGRARHRRIRLLMNRAASILTLVGGFSLRYVVVQAGRDSADDPQATFDMTRA